MFNPSILPIIAISVWRNKANSLSVLCGIRNNNPMNIFTGKGSEWSKTCIQNFSEEKFTKIFEMDASTITGDKDSPVELGVNLSKLVNNNFGIQIIETTSLAEAVTLNVVGNDKGQPVVYESNYKRDRDGVKATDENGKAIYRKSFLRAYDAEMVDILVKKPAPVSLDSITENVVESVSVETVATPQD